MQNNLLNEGLELMIFGMGTVFVFLVLMVGATRLLSFLVEKLDLADPVPVAAPAPLTAADNGRLVAVITAAIKQHQQQRR